MLFNKGFEYTPSTPTPPHWCGSLLGASRDERFDGAAVKASISTSYNGKLHSFVFVCFFPLLFHCNANTIKTNRELCRLPFKDTSHLPHVKC